MAQMAKNSAEVQGPRFEKIPWRSEWLPTPIFLPGELHAQRSLADYIVHGVTELDTTEQLTLSFLLHFL